METMSTENGLLFIIAAAFAIIGALSTVLAAKPLRAAMGLLLHILSLSALYISLHAQLLAALQVIVYAGAVVVLFVFVVMLIGPDSEAIDEDRGFLRFAGGFAAIALMLTTAATVMKLKVPETFSSLVAEDFGGVARFAEGMYLKAAIPFELVSVTLLVAIVGAVAIARGKTKLQRGDKA